jgi:5'-3' exonuclease
MRELSHHDLATGVIFGFLSRVLVLAHKFKTNDIVFCWDSKSSVRKKLYPEYKAQRRKDKTEKELAELEIAVKQFTTLRRKILPAIGFRNVFVQKGLEADDLIAKTVIKKEGRFVIVAADEDLFQLLEWFNVRMYIPTKKKIMTRERFAEEYGISPGYWYAVKQIAGCSSDNVKGVQGVGEKTAIKYLTKTLKYTSKAYKEITNRENAGLFARNLELVMLPHWATKEIERVDNEFSIKGFKKVCRKYGMESFLGPKLRQWKRLFAGDWPDDEPVKVVRRKRK